MNGAVNSTSLYCKSVNHFIPWPVEISCLHTKGWGNAIPPLEMRRFQPVNFNKSIKNSSYISPNDKSTNLMGLNMFILFNDYVMRN